MPVDAVAGARIGPYRLRHRLAVGGMAEVFLAEEERTSRLVALKRLLPQVASDPDFVSRFFHEIRIQAALRHPNVVELLDFDPAPSGGWLALEYIDGGSFQQLLASCDQLPWELALWVTGEALRGLGAAHERGIVHRDVKPQNVMWTRAGAVKIADFGISRAEHLTRLTVEGTVVGTPAFMSPEQARGEQLDPRSDLFSAGTFLYLLLTGRNPYTADSVAATLRRVAETEADPPSLVDPSIPPFVDRVVYRMTRKDRDARSPAASACLADIAAALAAGPAGDPATAFREFVADPAACLEVRRRETAREAAGEARRLLADRSARPEEALWAAYRTMAVAPGDETVKSLFAEAAQRAGQRHAPVDNARIRALEEELRHDPENATLLLQLAKLYRLEKDFVALMRFYRKLKDVAPPDAYTQGQIAALLAPAPVVVAAANAAATTSTAAGEDRRDGLGQTARAISLAAGAVILLVVLGVFWVRGPGRRPLQPSDEDRSRGAVLARRLASGRVVVETPGPASPGDPLQKALEKGALLEKEEGPARAAASYAESLPVVQRPESRGVLLLAISEARGRAGDRAGALAALDEAAGLGGASRTKALVARAEILEAGGADATRDWEAAASVGGEAVRAKATLRLALLADRSGDAARALVLYEELLQRSPESPEANPARLGAAALYRAGGRAADARRLYDEVRRRAPGTDFAKSADDGLKLLP